MKIFIIALLIITSLGSSAVEIHNSFYCKGSGQAVINDQRRLADTPDIKNTLDQMQKNLEYICESKRLSSDADLTQQERQLDMIKEALENEIIVDSSLDSFFLSMVLKGIATGEVEDQDIQDLFAE